MTVGKTRPKEAFLIDDEDYEKVMQYKWYSSSAGYIIGRFPRSRKIIYLHRFLICVPDNLHGDHINRNKLDNQKNNLRICTKMQNSANRSLGKNNTSGYKGVVWNKKEKRWRAVIWYKEKYYLLGKYETKNEAALAYNQAAIKLHGAFAALNKLTI